MCTVCGKRGADVGPDWQTVVPINSGNRLPDAWVRAGSVLQASFGPPNIRNLL